MAKFRKKTVVVEAIRITQPMVIHTDTGIAKGKPGDWLITGVAGEEYIVNDRVFHENYEPENDDAKSYLKEVEDDKKFGF